MCAVSYDAKWNVIKSVVINNVDIMIVTNFIIIVCLGTRPTTHEAVADIQLVAYAHYTVSGRLFTTCYVRCVLIIMFFGNVLN